MPGQVFSCIRAGGGVLAESEKKQSFWTTLPGFLTGVAALLTAVTGLLVAVYPHAVSGSKEGAAARADGDG